MHPAWLSGSKTEEQIKYLTKEWLICVSIFLVLTIVIALTQDFVDDCLHNFVEWICSFNGTLDVEAYWEQFKTFIGVQND